MRIFFMLIGLGMIMTTLSSSSLQGADSLPTPEQMRQKVEAELEKGLALWYPRSIDPRGGYHSIFEQDWSLQPYETKGIVQQSRMVWTASEVALRRPAKKEQFEKYAKHGYQFLRDHMWDKEYGGFYWEVKADGKAFLTANADMKHAYGEAFAIYGLANMYKLSKDPEVLKLAQEAFLWLDKHGHDAKNRGYIEAFYRDGTPMLAPPKERPEQVKGKTRELLGCKSMNSHLHLLEAFTSLYEVWPDATLKSRLVELLEIMRDVVPTWPGAMRQFFRADWTPAATYVSFGHDIETTYLLEEAEKILGNPSIEKTAKVGRAMVDHALEFGWDQTNGGFFYDGATFGLPADTTKFWWVQAEGLNTLLLMHDHYGKENADYYRCFIKQWEFIAKSILDARYGGWFPVTDADGSNPRGLDNRFSQVTRGLEKAHL
ncbi:MAG: AGE family epimerase/isomerase, partial [Planctomycetia bacterium]|nr:AGE family epimerase/isomerase [Planctomycetia bacterium]